MDSRQDFFTIISNYYLTIADSRIPIEDIKAVTEIITDYYFEQYKRFAKQYPKSLRRYSSFQIKELDHPTTFEIVIAYFKKMDLSNYRHYSGVLLNLNEEDLIKFEENREDFYRNY